jgi:hypothetical protein
MHIALDDLVCRWNGSHATFEVRLGEDLRAYHGILDGPYVGDDEGVDFMLGSRLIHGDIAVEGPLISFEPLHPNRSLAPILADGYVEMPVSEPAPCC